MKLRIGYNCINQSINRTYKSFRLATIEKADVQKIKNVIDYNMMTLGETIYWNTKNNFRLFRLTSNLIPFLSHPALAKYLEEVLYRECVINEFRRIEEMVQQTQSRITIHPSQMNVLSSSNSEIIKRTLNEIELQAHILKLCGGDTLLLHLGGAYGNKELAKRTLINNVNNYVSDNVRSVLAFENDDKTYNSFDVVEVCSELKLPWVYDFHHENLNKSPISVTELLPLYKPTKYHLCSGMGNKLVIEHDALVNADYAKEFFSQLESCGITEADVMFEAKSKNLAVTKIMEPAEEWGYWKLMM